VTTATTSAFTLEHRDHATAARFGCLQTAHGPVQTPVFMPVGTQATVKTMTPDELQTSNAEIILGNTYHLNLRPGMEIIEAAGGLHAFMGWNKPILTDSGGYQVFSLSKLRKLHADGVQFQSHIDGSSLFLGPREAMAIQRQLGSDIAMIFDECTPYPATHTQARDSLELTMRWAETAAQQPRAPGQLVFAIVQGGMYIDLRREAAQRLQQIGFDGYALGGLSVGEPEDEMFAVLAAVADSLPATHPRYVMGVGTPPQIVRAIAYGVDMFDCVLPTRVGRNGSAYTADGCIPIKAGRYKADFRPIEQNCQCYACRNFSRAYIRHLLNVSEVLALRLMTMHNIHFYLNLIQQIRTHIRNGSFKAFHDDFLARYRCSNRSSIATPVIGKPPAGDKLS